MCTATIIASAERISIMMNRDERRTRAPALPPAWRDVAGSRLVFPLDPEGGGTWIAGSEHGVIVGVLNRVGAQAAPAGRRSRGEIPLLAAHAPDAGAAIAHVAESRLVDYAPFDVFAVGRDGIVHHGCSDGRSFQRSAAARAPWMLTSSSVSTEALAARRSLFEAFLLERGDECAQRRFHEHCWPDRRAISVLMTRDDARTMSITSIFIARHGPPRMEYRAV